MSQSPVIHDEDAFELPGPPDVDHLITEDDTPVDNIFSEHQQRLLTESLYASWNGPDGQRGFVAYANVGLFASPHKSQPLAPNVLVSVDVEPPDDVWSKHSRAYFIWEHGKPPDVVIEIVSNRKGHETDQKHLAYARMGVGHYVVFDPLKQVQPELLRVYERVITQFQPRPDFKLPLLGLGLMLWEGTYDGIHGTWLRWVNLDTHQMLATGVEAREQEKERAEQEKARAEQEKARADRLQAKLLALGVDPTDLEDSR